MTFHKKLVYAIRKSTLGVGSALIGIALLSGMADVHVEAEENDIELVQPEVEVVTPPESDTHTNQENEIDIAIHRKNDGKEVDDLTGLNGETLNLSIDLNVSREDTVISDAKLVVESDLVKDGIYDTRHVVRDVSVSGLNGGSSPVVERVSIDDAHETVRHTISLGNLSTGSRVSLPVIVHSFSGFDDDQTHDIRYRLMSGDRIVHENKVTLRFDGYDIPKTGIALIPESYRHAALYGVDNLSSDNPGAILGEWETDLNKIGRRRSLYYNIKNLIDTTHGQLTSPSNNGAWDTSHYRIRLTIPEHFEFESDSRLSKVDYDAKGSTVDIHFPSFRDYKNLLKTRVGYSNESLTYGSDINDFRLHYTGTDKIDHVDVKWEVIDTRTNAPIDNLTTTYRHAVYFPNYKQDKPVKPVYGNDGFTVSNGLVINNKEVIKKYASPISAFINSESSTDKGYHTDQEEGARPLHDNIYKRRSIDDVYAIGGDDAISLKGDVVFTIDEYGTAEHISNLHKPFSKIMVDPVKLSNGEALQDYTWTVDRIATSEEFDYKLDKEILDEDGFTTGYKIYDIEHRWRNARVYKENIQTSETTDVGTLGDLLTHRYNRNDYDSDVYNIADKLMMIRPTDAEPVYYYTKQPITLTNHERLVIDFGEHRAGDIKLYTSHHLQASDYEKITENNQAYTNDLSHYDGATIKPTLVRPVSFINNGKRFTHDYNVAKLVRFDLPKNHVSPRGNILISKDVDGGETSMNFIDQSGVLSLSFGKDYQTHIHNEEQFGDMKYLVDLPTGIDVSNWRIRHSLENGSTYQPIDATVYKRIGDRIVYELVIPHDQRLKYGNEPQVSNPINGLDVFADISYNASIRPQNDRKSIDWVARHGIMYQPLSSVIYERSEYGDPTDWNGDGKLDAYTNDEPLTGWVTHVMGETTTTLRLPESLFIRNVNALGDQDLAIRDDVRAGSDASFKTLIENRSGADYRDVTVITVLPKAGDDLFNGSKDRGSTMNATLKEVVSPIDGWTVEYTTAPHLDGTHAKDLTGWVGADAIRNFSTVTAIRYKTQPNHVIRQGDVVSLPFTVITPANANVGDQFVSTSAVAFNGSSNYLEGYHAIATIYRPKGSVTVAYENENGERIHPDVTDLPNTTFAGTPYDTSEHALAHIRHQDKDYTLLKRKESSSPQSGEVAEGETRVVYVYKEGSEPVERIRRLKASATLIYTDKQGTPLKEAVSTGDVFIGTVTERVYPDRVEVLRYDTENASYNFTSNKLATIDVNGVMYHLQNDDLRLNGFIDQLFVDNHFTGNPNMTLRLIYDAERGSVVYRVLEKETNKEVVSPQIYPENVIVGTEYDLSYDLEAIRSNITTSQDGRYYRYSHHEGNVTGNVVKGETVMTVYVAPITGDVTVRYVDGDGELIKTETVSTVVNDDYDVTSLRLDTLTHNDHVYRLNRVDGNLTGKMTADTEGGGPGGVTNVTPHNKVVTLVYNVERVIERGTVVFRPMYGYGDLNGDDIRYIGFDDYKDLRTDPYITSTRGDVRYTVVDNEVVGTPYTIEPVEYITTNGIESQDRPELSRYYPYALLKGSLTGEVTSGTTVVEYWYRHPEYTSRRGFVTVKYVDESGHEIAESFSTPSRYVQNDYYRLYSDGRREFLGSDIDDRPVDVSAKKLDVIDHENVRYTFKEIKDGGTLTPLPKIGEQVITLVYTKTPAIIREETGKVVIRYVTENGQSIKDNVVEDAHVVTIIEEQLMADGSTTTHRVDQHVAYDVMAKKLEEIESDGKVYRYVRHEGKALTGELEAGLNDIAFIYDVVKGDVEVRYVDTTGTEIKDKVVTHDDQPIKSDYDVNTQKVDEIEFNGKVYRYVRTDGEVTGKVKEETTVVTYVYAEVLNIEQPMVYIPNDYPTVDKPSIEFDVPNDYPTTEQPLVEFDVPNDYPTVDKPSVEFDVPNNYPTVEQPLIEFDVPNSYPTVEQPSIEFDVPNDYPTVDQPSAEFDVPNDYPTVEQPSAEFEVPNDYPTVEQSVAGVPKVETSHDALPNTGETDMSMIFGIGALSILSGLGLVKPRRNEE